jgi:hypothetical protein
MRTAVAVTNLTVRISSGDDEKNYFRSAPD